MVQGELGWREIEIGGWSSVGVVVPEVDRVVSRGGSAGGSSRLVVWLLSDLSNLWAEATGLYSPSSREEKETR